jgi:hypothetical protein
MPAGVTAATFIEDPDVIAGTEEGIATGLEIPASWVKATLSLARRLSLIEESPSRRLQTTANIKVDFTISIPEGATQTASSLTTALSSADSTAWGTALTDAISAKTGATYSVVVSSIAAVLPPSPSPSEDDGVDAGLVVGIVLIILFVGFMALVGIYFLRKRMKSGEVNEDRPADIGEEEVESGADESSRRGSAAGSAESEEAAERAREEVAVVVEPAAKAKAKPKSKATPKARAGAALASFDPDQAPRSQWRDEVVDLGGMDPLAFVQGALDMAGMGGGTPEGGLYTPPAVGDQEDQIVPFIDVQNDPSLLEIITREVERRSMCCVGGEEQQDQATLAQLAFPLPEVPAGDRRYGAWSDMLPTCCATETGAASSSEVLDIPVLPAPSPSQSY